MSKKEHELLDARCTVVRAIAEGLEKAKVGHVEPEDREFFEKMEEGMAQLEERRAEVNMPKVWGRAGLKGAEKEEEDRKDDRGRRKERKRDSKEGRHRERRESRDEKERRYRERKDSEGKKRKSSRRSSSRSE